MYDEVVRTLANHDRRIEKLESLPHPRAIVDPVLALPGLRGCWPMSSFNENGNAYDMSGQGRTLTYNGNPTYNFTGLVPYIDFDGTGDFLSRADEAGLDIIGTENYVAAAARGLTFGGWFYPKTTNKEVIMAKADNSTGPYALWNDDGNDILFRVRNAADAATFLVTIAITLSAWQFIVGRYDPSTELKVWRNISTNTNVTNIPASILDGNDTFCIGGYAGAEFEGLASLCFLCAAALSDMIIESLFQRTRSLFGV